jgi:heme/copper-type cytochrome/quinol oxidase subunit 4
MSLNLDQKMALTRTICNIVGVIISIVYVIWVMSK